MNKLAESAKENVTRSSDAALVDGNVMKFTVDDTGVISMDEESEELIEERLIQKRASSYDPDGIYASNTDTPFSWDNVNMYFVITDRFYNGDESNDHSYGRSAAGSGNVSKSKDSGNKEDAAAAYTRLAGSYAGSGESNASNYKNGIGTFHGGDLKGLTDYIENGYFDALGTNAIWITAPYEQVHGAVCGGGFKHYAYHGYYTLDYTEVDANMGTAEELEKFIDTAHAHGIRVVFDVVMNHSGYPDGYTIAEYYGESSPLLSDNWRDIYFGTNESNLKWDADYENVTESFQGGIIRYNDAWNSSWFTTSWQRMVKDRYGSGYTNGEGTSLTLCSAGLPDFKTEDGNAVSVPDILQKKWTAEGRYDTKIAETNAMLTACGYSAGSASVRQYLVAWLSNWVREYGVDGFRCDTAKHVEIESWKELKVQCKKALTTWRSNHPDKPGAEWTDDFWMTGEVYDYGADPSLNSGGTNYAQAFDSLINFSFQGNGGKKGAELESTYSSYASSINNSPNNVLSYISSHDKGLGARGASAGTALLLCPGGVQTYYGDETASGSTTVPLIWVYDDKKAYSGTAWDSRDKMTLDEAGKYYEWSKTDLTGGVYVIVTDGDSSWRSVPDKKNSAQVSGSVELDPSKDYTDTSAFSKVVIATGDPCKVTIHYVDQANTAKPLKSIYRIGLEGDPYHTYASEIDGYELTGTPKNANGTFTAEEIVVNYVYTSGDDPVPKNGTVITHYVDEEENEIADPEILTGTIGEDYAAQAKQQTIQIGTKSYQLKPGQSTATGTYTAEDIHVTYTYEEVKAPDPVKTGKVLVQYVDEQGNEPAEPVTLTGTIGTSYGTIASPTITIGETTYRIQMTPDNAAGKYTADEIVVVYIYEEDSKPVKTGTVVVKYIDEDGKEIAESHTFSGTAETAYTTNGDSEIRAGESVYRLKTTPGNASGQYTTGTIEVIYVYERVDKSDGGNTDNGNTDSENADGAKTDSGKTDREKTDSENTDSAKADSGKTDRGNTDSGKTDASDTPQPAEEKSVQVGDTVTDDSGKAYYEIAGTSSVKYAAPAKAEKQVVIPASVQISGKTYRVTAIAADAFGDDTTLQEVKLGKNVTKIGNDAFNGCRKLKKVTLDAKLTTIGEGAFYGCTKLAGITIPAKVKKIGSEAFYGCKSLKKITIKTTKLTKKNVGSKAFKGIYKKASIQVPKSKLGTYKTMLRSKGVSKNAKIKK